jgi:predicted acyl esterase
MSDRREFFKTVLGGALVAIPIRSAFLFAEDAGALKVEPGVSLPVRIQGARIEYLRLVMPDGVRLAATLYLPEKLEGRIPVILEVLPYRKDDDYLGRDVRNHGFYARSGYAGLRLDVRGTGASEGHPEDEYSVKEHEDTLHVIDWLSRQSWSNGNVGMTGISYGAFNSVQIAAMQPKALKAILAVAGTDDRYTDDVHYIGGALHLFENTWAVGMVSSNAMPAAPGFDVSGAMARERFDARPWILRWLHEQTDGPYWRRGSLRPAFEYLRFSSADFSTATTTSFRASCAAPRERPRVSSVPGPMPIPIMLIPVRASTFARSRNAGGTSG